MTDTPDLPDSLFLVDAEEAAGATLSFSRATTVLLTFAANRFTRSAARLYQQEFGIGAMDWRMLVMLTRVPGCSVATASRTMGIDKAAVSRSLARLEQTGLAAATCNSPDERRKDWSLTGAGQALHGRILAVALQRQKELLAGFTEEEVTAFNGYLTRLLENLEELNSQG
ncbi:MarR family transcriptional regulator [Alisedimentitalea sp. MJ-SS2]|uniref:MarR family winged helix-turn-helix transcriptional regulator n=1 Tax=Aliisedimentitalea sp. MJ-SS2 TaxID=3049795 RepID=UPI002906F72D|nr:MarR family transcriptional regulator [Alisedimentitalea sp. MJ-SS2]MDU8928645.1 MarR family transcriptional regulator [Alisedimentitalea sp. MJ-SS2]